MPDTAKTRLITKNRILDALSDEDFQRLLPHLEPIDLKLGQTLYRPEGRINYVYFPVNSMASVIATTADGEAAEVGVIGCEGMVGVEVILGVDSSSKEVIVQGANGAFRVKTEDIRAEFNLGKSFQKIILRFVYSLMTQISQTALCNRLHVIEQRLARWLLLSHDRAEADELTLTQDFLSVMLGVNRPTVTTSAIILQGAGFIKYMRGHITILDREGLEDFACECYETVQEAYKN
jgi:CRP-like cAMP-binding protein